MLFPALAANGYQVKVLAASCVDWMELKDTVFGGVPAEDLETWCEGVEPPLRDAAMIRDAKAFAAQRRPGPAGVPVPVLLRDPLQLLPRRRRTGSTAGVGRRRRPQGDRRAAASS